jgi:hypothetical protein
MNWSESEGNQAYIKSSHLDLTFNVYKVRGRKAYSQKNNTMYKICLIIIQNIAIINVWKTISFSFLNMHNM